jgi:hypothetical protein
MIVLMTAVANEMHENEARGSTYITVDHPAVIATYLQFVLPRYPSSMSFTILLTRLHPR